MRDKTTVLPHGNYVRYTYGCRCEPCRDAKAEYVRAKRAQRRVAKDFAKLMGLPHVVEGIVHGRAGYDNHICRCDVCRAAKNAARYA